jgi:DNA polymerase I-like protein with 3'-5' exonuclease and polymerase domains
MASLSGDPVMCEGFNSGKDFHTYTASQFVADQEPYLKEFIKSEEDGKNELGDYILNEDGSKQLNPNYGKLVPYEKVLKHMRGAAKAINFGLAYGMGPAALADRLGIQLEVAKSYITQYNTTFKVLVTWLGKQREKALIRRAFTYEDYMYAKKNGSKIFMSLGYSETPSGRKRFYRIPITPKEVLYANTFHKFKTKSGSFVWVSEKLGIKLPFNPKDPWDKELIRLAKEGESSAQRIRSYHSKMAGIKREGGNGPIQGTNADMTKVAMYLFRKYIKDYEKDHNNGEYIAHILLQVYDELLVEVPEELSELFGDKLTECMVKAGERYIKNVPVSADCVIGDHWIH